MKRTNIYLSDDQNRELEILAKAGVSSAEHVRRAVDAYLQRPHIRRQLEMSTTGATRTIPSRQSAQLGPLTVVFHRTIRVPQGNTPSSLPPSRGTFPVYKVSDLGSLALPQWDREGYVIPIKETEAMWMAFSCAWDKQPVAVAIGAGGINAVSGEKMSRKLQEDGYLVTPPQPWLDGFKSPDGHVYQFVGTEHKGGEGHTVAEQIIGEESVSGGLAFSVYEAKEGAIVVPKPSTHLECFTMSMDSDIKSFSPAAASLSSSPRRMRMMRGNEYSQPDVQKCATRGPVEMGLGRGGAIEQKVYPDPHGLSAWKAEPSAVAVVYLISEREFNALLGLPTGDVASTDNTSGPYFKTQDKHLADTEGSEKFEKVKAVPVGAKAKLFPGD